MRLSSLNGLRAFEAVARLGSAVAAGAQLHVTASAVSHQLRALEDELRVQLFERRPRSLRITPAGAALARSVGRAFADIAEAARRVAPARPRLSVSVLPSFAARWLTPRLPRFEARHVELRIHASRELARFARDEVDAAIRYAPRPPRGLHAEPLLADELFPACAPRLLRRLRAPADLRRVRLLHDDTERRQGGWDDWLRAAGVPRFDFDGGTFFTDAHVMLEAAAAGQGVAMARSSLAEADLARGRLVRPFRLSVPARYRYWFVCPKAALRRPELRAFREFLLREAAR